MPSYDFEVDLQAVVAAAKGVADTIQLFKDNDVEDLVPTKDAVGHDVVWDALDEFKDRWELGVNNLTRDVEEIAGRLAKVAMNYAEFDRDGHARMTAVAAEMRGLQVMPR